VVPAVYHVAPRLPPPLVSFIALFCGVASVHVVLKLHRTMEHADDVQLVVGHEPIDDPVVPPKQDAKLTPRGTAVRLPELGKLPEDLSSLVDGLNDVECVDWAIQDDVVVDLQQPTLRLLRPNYLRQLSIRRAISSFEMVLPASESAIPRSTMAANASSRRISSTELSSGWSSITRISCALAGVICGFYRVPRPPPRVRRTPGISCEAVSAYEWGAAGMSRRSSLPGAGESFVSFIPLLGSSTLLHSYPDEFVVALLALECEGFRREE
jgi:hypothetical protein